MTKSDPSRVRHRTPPDYAQQFSALYRRGVSPVAFGRVFGLPAGRLYNWTQKAYPPAMIDREPCQICGGSDAVSVDYRRFCAPCVNAVGDVVAALVSMPEPTAHASVLAEASRIFLETDPQLSLPLGQDAQ